MYMFVHVYIYIHNFEISPISIHLKTRIYYDNLKTKIALLTVCKNIFEPMIIMIITILTINSTKSPNSQFKILQSLDNHFLIVKRLGNLNL